MAGPRQPIDLLEYKGNKHLTKAEAEARRAASIIISSSIRLSLTGELVDWTTNTSEPRTVS